MDNPNPKGNVRGPHNTGVPETDQSEHPRTISGLGLVNLWLTRFGSMSEYHARMVVHNLNGHTDSVDEQGDVLVGMDEKGVSPHHDGIRRKEVEDVLEITLDFRARTSLRNLVQIGMVERDPEVPEDLRTFIIADWMGADGEIVNGRVADVAREAIEAIIQHVHDTDVSEGDREAIADGSGVPLRQVLAETFDIAPADVEEYLREGDLVRNVREAVQAIEDHPVVSPRDDYGMIRFRNEAYRYRLTGRAINLLRL